MFLLHMFLSCPYSMIPSGEWRDGLKLHHGLLLGQTTGKLVVEHGLGRADVCFIISTEQLGFSRSPCWIAKQRSMAPDGTLW